MAETDYKDAIPTLKDEIDRATVDSVLALDVDKYKYGFETAIESDRAPMGLNEDTVRFISAKKGEPEWMLEWRLGAQELEPAEVARRSRSGPARDVRKARRAAQRARTPRRRRAAQGRRGCRD